MNDSTKNLNRNYYSCLKKGRKKSKKKKCLSALKCIHTCMYNSYFSTFDLKEKEKATIPLGSNKGVFCTSKITFSV